MEVRKNYETLSVECAEGYVIVTINRPDKLNALNELVLTELMEAIDQTVLASGARAMVLTGAGDKAFVAGADIASMRELEPDDALHFARLGQELTKLLESAPFITIAQVDGFALGGGCELAMACDIVIASEKSLFGQPEVDLGLIPGFGGTQRLARRVGLPMAMSMLVGGLKLKAPEALRSGLISQMTSSDELDDAVMKTLQNILKAAPFALQETKRLARESLETPLSHGLAAEASAFAGCFARSESKEGITAFIEKRPASFSL